MPETTKHLGAFIRWLLKGCKTKLIDEVDGNFEPKILRSYDAENYILGLISSAVFLGIIALIFVI